MPHLIEKTACISLIAFMVAGVITQVLVLLGIVPKDMIWGGRVQQARQLYALQAVSLLINAVLLVLVGIEWGVIPAEWLSAQVLTGIWWVFCGVFLLNTLGNLNAKNRYERIIFSPMTLVAAVCCAILAMG